ncbi:MAG: hypothetical protein ACRCUY_10900, partial [Thermoguttaceae bacterium]
GHFMAQYYYFNESGEKVGPVRGRDIQSLAAQGVITPETMIELPDGTSFPARKVKRLTFSPANAPPQSAIPTMVPPPFPFTPLNSTDNPFSLPIPSDNPFTLQASHKVAPDTPAPVPGTHGSRGGIPKPLLIGGIAVCLLVIVVSFSVFSVWMKAKPQQEEEIELSGLVGLLRAERKGTVVEKKARSVVVTIDTFTNDRRSAHGAIYEVLVNGEKVASKHSTDGFAVFSVSVPTNNWVRIEGKVLYKNGYGSVMNERTVSSLLEKDQSSVELVLP